ncbi:hypothetical protein COCC4DRAFT_31759 [Bipolaris maydis ATCC 48331]|uniref:Uncharacterized protein n=2 Tax=Cochliobolus heterostrophus TaxID=5016 RepID=M2UBG6_COCH5|nr:uncharacterized protein COCC4DRAFT_31759 [Bipolaris maydis ATCC 48331]EMD91056.1 hypothetical protein COCHEDRAFT_1021800 [Bipolaris maydis C5]ENI05861.1 hypothetical protein COCC4DRAFT_31759 [Bipolaris maydis ATCC 48331]
MSSKDPDKDDERKGGTGKGGGFETPFPKLWGKGNYSFRTSTNTTISSMRLRANVRVHAYVRVVQRK